ncbi:MerR family transcriptional regulator [Saccharothrix mutabilis subsp. mutabilis]|uniref:MerR family transcriptional regulator n=1 Tax=Saccharothrix mutabilis subsp. mutabilis TaxID=66855 RepID=A0ABN0UE31_9PSEU
MGKDGTALRPVDLARAAGISTQQVRNYLDAGVLPPAERSEFGYRRFEERHRRALLTFRVLGRGYGWDAAQSMMLAAHAGDIARTLDLVDLGHVRLHEQRQSLQAVAEALEAVAEGAQQAPPVPRAGMRIGEVANRLAVRPSALRVWESAGLLTPDRDADGHRRYTATDVRDAQVISMLRRGRHPLPQVKSIMEHFRRTSSSEALREAVHRQRAALTRRAMTMLEGAAMLHRYLTEHLTDQAPAG